MAIDYTKLSDDELEQTIARLKGGSSNTVRARQAGLPSLADHRNRFAKEMADNPAVLRRLVASARAEVGTQGEEAIQAYLETVTNRAIARNKSLDSTVFDPSYYPKVTIDSVRAGASDGEVNRFQPIIDRVLGGSNITHFATGNESGGENSGGAPITYKAGGERFVVENPDSGWSRKVNANADVADSPVRSILPASNVIERVDTSKIQAPQAAVTRRKGDILSRDDLLLYAQGAAQDIAMNVIKSGGNLTREQYSQLILNQYDDAQKLNVVPLKKTLPDAVLADAANLVSTPDMVQHLKDLHAVAIAKKAPGFGSWLAASVPREQDLSQEGVAFNTARQALVPIIARGIQQQTGPLSNDDIAKAQALLPQPGDSVPTVATKTAELNKILQGNIRSKIDIYRDAFDTSILEKTDNLLSDRMGEERRKIEDGNPAVDQTSQAQLAEMTRQKIREREAAQQQASQAAATPAGTPAGTPSTATAEQPQVLTPQESAELGRRDVREQTQSGGFVSPWTTRGTSAPASPQMDPEYVGR